MLKNKIQLNGNIIRRKLPEIIVSVARLLFLGVAYEKSRAEYVHGCLACIKELMVQGFIIFGLGDLCK